MNNPCKDHHQRLVALLGIAVSLAPNLTSGDDERRALLECDLLSKPPPVEQGIPTSLKIGYRPDAAPFSYLNDDEKPAGYIVGLCTEIAKTLVGKGKVDYVPVSSGSRFRDLAGGRIDLLCDSSTLTLRHAACFDHTLLTFPSGPALAAGGQFSTPPPKGASLRVGVLANPSSTATRAGAEHIQMAISASLGVTSIELVPMDSYNELFDALTGDNTGTPTSEVRQDRHRRISAVLADREILLARANREPGLFDVRNTYFS